MVEAGKEAPAIISIIDNPSSVDKKNTTDSCRFLSPGGNCRCTYHSGKNNWTVPSQAHLKKTFIWERRGVAYCGVPYMPREQRRCTRYEPKADEAK